MVPFEKEGKKVIIKPIFTVNLRFFLENYMAFQHFTARWCFRQLEVVVGDDFRT